MVPTKSSAVRNPIYYGIIIELTDQLAFLSNIFFYFNNFRKKNFDILYFIMRINPTTSDPGVSALEKKKLGTYSSNHRSGTGCNFPPGKCLIFTTLW